ncbi:MAG: alpha/beta hydrolase [Pseudomonadota bacterium]
MLIRLIFWTLAGLSLLLLSGALITWQHKLRVEARFPPVGHFFAVDGLRLHYQVRREAAPGAATLVFLHGASTNLRDFGPLLAALDGGSIGLVSVDRPGAGYSTQNRPDWVNPGLQADAIAALQRELKLERAVWVGHSLAGSVVMAGLLRHGGEPGVSAGVLLAGAAYDWTGGVDLVNHLPAWPGLGPLLTHSVVTPMGLFALNGGIRNAFAPEPVTANYRERSGIGLYLRPGQFAATARDVRLLSDYLRRQSEGYQGIEQPVLIIHGAKDDIVPAWNHADRLVKVLPRSVYYPIAGGGHQPHHVHTDQVADWIQAFTADLNDPRH